MRFYGFAADEVGAATDDGMLPLDVDPKFAWALKFRDRFPVDVNRADKEHLLRVPGLGTRAVKTMLSARRHRQLRLDDVGRLTTSIAKVRPFIVTADWRPVRIGDRDDLRALLTPPAQQLELFAA
jgi:predicted DNA-binding helix-hairpin-helix protein